MTFKVGQRITYSGRIGYDREYYEQVTGRIIATDIDCDQVLVEFDRNIGGHNGLGDSKKGSCWWLDNNELLKGAQFSNIFVNIRNLI